MAHLEEKKWIQFEVVTETGVCLGWVRNSSLATKDSNQITLVVVPSSVGWLPEKLVGAYELASIELICVGSERLIVAEGFEEKLEHLKVGILERLGLIRLPWMQQEEAYSLRIDSRGEDGDTGFQPAIRPRSPSPKPMNDAAEIP